MSGLSPTLVKRIDSFLASIETVFVESPGSEEDLPLPSIARRWQLMGLLPGYIVIIVAPNNVATLRQFFGVIHAGGVPALVAPSTPIERLRAIISAFDAFAIVVPQVRLGVVDQGQIFTIGSMQAIVRRRCIVPITSEGEVILVTSGTSGFSSGCVFSFEALLTNARKHSIAIKMCSRDILLVNLPLYYSYALVAQVLSALEQNARLVISGPPFEARSYERLLHERGITISSLTPVLVRTLLRHARPHTNIFPQALRGLTVGGSFLESIYVDRLLRERPNGELYLTYGLTEAGPRVSTLSAHLENSDKFGSVGRPLPNTFVKVDSLTGYGELLVSSDTLMRRRIGLVEGKFKRDWYAPDTLASGDIFIIDDDGYLFFQGRVSDYIVRNDEKINITSILRIAHSLPCVIRASAEKIKLNNNDVDFDLFLYVTSVREARAHQIERSLLSQLRRSERPRHLHIIAIDDEKHNNHK